MHRDRNNPSSTIPIEAFRAYFDDQEWEPGTYNRQRTVLFSLYRLSIENDKVTCNPAAKLKRKKVSDDRCRFLNQFEPLPTEIDYLKPLQSEEGRLRAVIAADYPEHMEEFDIALNTGLRRKEQYVRIDWSSVDLARKDLRVPQSKNGEGRHIPLNVEARSAVKKAGLRDFTWHSLRHTFASRLVMADVDIRTVAELLGHKTLAMTMRYTHLAPEHKLVAVERLTRYNS